MSRVYVGKERAFAGIINTKAKLFVESLGIIKFEFVILLEVQQFSLGVVSRVQVTTPFSNVPTPKVWARSC